MEPMPARESDSQGLLRQAAVAAALELVDADGAEGLSMRALADRLGIKAASLYWHFRDKEELLDALATEVVDRVRLPQEGTWRERLEQASAALAADLSAHPARARLLLRGLGAVRRSELVRGITAVVAGEGAPDAESAAVTLLVAVAGAADVASGTPLRPLATQVATLDIESGAWRIVARAGQPGMSDVARTTSGSPLVIRPDGTVVVHAWRGGGQRGAVELNPAYRWYVKVHSGAWNLTLDLGGVRVTGVEIDSGAGKVTCTLPAPQGVVPVRINSGIVGVSLHRPAHTAARAVVHQGSVRVRLDGRAMRMSSGDVTWRSDPGWDGEDCYDLAVHSGCVRVSLDADAPAQPMQSRASEPHSVVPASPQDPAAAPRLVLDGIAQHIDSVHS